MVLVESEVPTRDASAIDGVFGFSERSETEAFLEHSAVAEHHWGYQPYRINRMQLPSGEILDVFNISGRNKSVYLWNDVNQPVDGYNQEIAEECYRLLNDGNGSGAAGVFDSRQFGFQVSPSYFDWLEDYDPDLHRQIKEKLGTKAEFATTPTQHILPLLPPRIADIQIELGIEMYHEDFPDRPGPLGFWPAELAVAAGSTDREGTIDQLARHGIRFLILYEDQLETPRKAPLYRVTTERGNTMYILPGSRELSGDYGYTKQTADAYIGKILNKGTVNGVNQSGANDLETFTGRFGIGYMEFLDWMYNRILPKMVEEGSINWQRTLDMAEDATLTNSSWSCKHGFGRWWGDPNCDCDGATGEIQAEKRFLFTGLTAELNDVTSELDEVSGNSAAQWETQYIDWQMSIRKKLAAGGIISAENVSPEFQILFLRLHNALMGLQSCAFFFATDYERNMAKRSLETVRILKSAQSQSVPVFES